MRAPALNRTEVRQAPPGAIVWVLRNGSLRHGMPSFAHLPEGQRWEIVAFLQGKRYEAPRSGGSPLRRY